MFTTLIESGGRGRSGHASWLSWSIAIHAALITLAVARTMHDVEPSAPTVDLVPLRFIVPPPPVTPRLRTAESSEEGLAGPMTVAIPRFSVPDFRHIDIPQPSTTLALTDDWRPSESILARSRPGVAGSTGVYTDAAVDRVVIPRPGNGSPAYPRALRAAALEGDVRVRFVVDTSGSVEPGSLTILASSHELFANAVRQWLPRTHYQPAEVAGRRVRQLVEQRVSFTLQR